MLSSIIELVAQQLTANRNRFGPKTGTQNWWLDRSNQKPGHKYTVLWTHFPDYQLRGFKALAELDYKVLGLELTGAPYHPHRLEEGQVAHFPVKVLSNLIGSLIYILLVGQISSSGPG